MDAQDRFPADMARAKVYKTLAECYHRPTDATLRYSLELADLLETICPQAADAASAISANENLDELSVDHARLFIGPFALMAPPYGSVHLEGEHRCMGESTLDAARCYAEFGLGAAPGYQDALDHIAVELEFVHFLCVREIDALTRRASDEAQDLQAKQRCFLEKHLAAWVPEFTASVETHAQTHFYRNLARVTRLFIASDVERLIEQSAVAA
jgi:putative dimethyl sulfoxide reductase chaperone